eukprot:scaffold24622_cov142-Cylindrotheca_fusiformis.AAC.1
MGSNTTTRNSKSNDNRDGNDHVVPMTFAAAPLNHPSSSTSLSSSGQHQHRPEQQQQQQEYTSYQEEQEIAPEMIQVITVDGDGRQLGVEENHPQLPQELDPSTIQVVTIDDEAEALPPPLGSNTGVRSRSATIPYATTLNEEEEGTPLLHGGEQRGGDLPDGGRYNDSLQDLEHDSSSSGSARCRDIPWAILFWLHLAIVIYLGLQVSPKGYEKMKEVEFDVNKIHDFLQLNAVNDDDFTEDDLEMLTKFLRDFQAWWPVYPPRIFWFVAVMSWVNFILNMVKNQLIIRPYALFFVTSSLILPLVILGALVVLILVMDPSNNLWIFLFGVLFVGLLTMYVRRTLWPKIHFAAINLQIALAGIGHNLGTYFSVLCCSELTVFWVLFWTYMTIGLVSYLDATYCPSETDGLDGARFLESLSKKHKSDPEPACGPSTVAVLMLLVSFYWTCSFISNSVQVFVAGVMATWCFEKESARGCCSTAITSSMYRSLTFSSGPIAFGSLLQGTCKAIRSILRHSNQRRDSHVVQDIGDDCRCCCFGLVGLVLDCLSELFGEVLDYFTQWAYVFVGVYGQSYLESGKSVMDLFRNRGWMVLITDRLVFFVLGVGVLESGIANGLYGILVERLITHVMYGDQQDQSGLPPSYVFGDLTDAAPISFLTGFVVGCVMSSIAMSVVYGAVNTLIVCWAESPASFTENHKGWAEEMTRIWSSAYPGTQLQDNYHSSTSTSSFTVGSDQGRPQSTMAYGATNNAVI